MEDKTIQTKSVAYKNNDTLIINCMNEENINSLVNTLGEKLSNNFKIEKEQINKPKLKVIDIDMENSNDNEIEQDINQRNFSNIEDNCKVLHVYKNERTNRKCAIVEVTSYIYKYIKDNKSRLFIGHLSCRVYDIINTTPWNKYSRFWHSSKKCENSATCNTCAKVHVTSKCTSVTKNMQTETTVIKSSIPNIMLTTVQSIVNCVKYLNQKSKNTLKWLITRRFLLIRDSLVR